MDKLLRVVLLQLLLLAGLATSDAQLLAAPMQPHTVSDSSVHCLDCPATNAESVIDCCIQPHQGCSSCVSIQQGAVTLTFSANHLNFPELHKQPSQPFHAPIKPPPRSVLTS